MGRSAKSWCERRFDSSALEEFYSDDLEDLSGLLTTRHILCLRISSRGRSKLPASIVVDAVRGHDAKLFVITALM